MPDSFPRGKGVISVTSNLMPKEKHDEVALFNAGKQAEALAIQAKILAFEKALFMDVNPIPVKEALNIMGFKAGECRLPLCSMSDEQIAKLRSAMEPARISRRNKVNNAGGIKCFRPIC